MNELLQTMERYRDLVDDWSAFIDSLQRPLPTCLWTNTLRCTARSLQEILREEGLQPDPLSWNPATFRIQPCDRLGTRWWYMAGLCHSQEEVSLLPVELLDCQPGQRVLDLCAAPGGKTARMALALNNRGTIVANDPQPGRMNMLRSNLKRLGILNVTTVLRDGGSFPRRAGGFDRILVDAPCSCEGTVRKHPGTVLGEPRRPVRQQEAFLATAARLCRPGGRIVYSTCTFAPEENEAVVHAILQRSEGKDLRVVRPVLPDFKFSPGVTEWEGVQFHPSLADTFRVWPHHNDSGGFFVAVLEKDPGARDVCEVPPPLSATDAPEVDDAIFARFGIPADSVAGYTFHQRTSKGLYLVSDGHTAPLDPPPYASGLVFMRTMRPNKPSTPAAMILGRLATRNVLELLEEELSPFFARDVIPVSEERLSGCELDGTVIVRYRGIPLGTAFYPRSGGRIRSLFPKGWSVEMR